MRLGDAAEARIQRRDAVRFCEISQVQRDRLRRRGQWLKVVLAAPTAKIVPVGAVRLERVRRLGVSGVVLGLLGDRLEACERARVRLRIEAGVILVLRAKIAGARRASTSNRARATSGVRVMGEHSQPTRTQTKPEEVSASRLSSDTRPLSLLRNDL